MVDLSVSGVGAVARTAPNLGVGSVADLALNEHRVLATVRRVVTNHADPEESFYGLQFISASPDFVEAIFIQAGAEPRDTAERFWIHAS